MGLSSRCLRHRNRRVPEVSKEEGSKEGCFCFPCSNTISGSLGAETQASEPGTKGLWCCGPSHSLQPRFRTSCSSPATFSARTGLFLASGTLLSWTFCLSWLYSNHLADVFSSFKIQFKCHLLQKAFPESLLPILG